MSLHQLASAALTLVIMAGTQSTTFAQTLKTPTHPTLAETGISVDPSAQGVQTSPSDFKNPTHPTLPEIGLGETMLGQASQAQMNQPKAQNPTHPTLSDIGNNS